MAFELQGSMRCRSARRVAVGALLLALGAVLSTPARAQSEAGPLSPFGIRVGQAISWDANVFRVADSAPDPLAASGTPGKSDRIVATTVGLSFDQVYGQQRFAANVGQTATRYDKFTGLNRDALSYRGAWYWQLTPRFSGIASVDHSESIVGFEDTQLFRKNVSALTTRSFLADAWLFGGWHLLAGYSEFERKNSLVFAAVPSITQTTREGSIRYVARSQSSITLTRRERRGTNSGQAVDLVNFVDSGFTVSENEVAVNWIASARSSLRGVATRIDRRNENVPQRDFSGTALDVGYQWQPTGRLGLNVGYVRSITPYAPDTTSTFRVDRTLSAGTDWQVTEKVRAYARWSRGSNDYLGPVAPVAGPLRSDVLRTQFLGVDWTPLPRLTLRSSLQKQQRTSNVAAFQFDATLLSAEAVVNF